MRIYCQPMTTTGTDIRATSGLRIGTAQPNRLVSTVLPLIIVVLSVAAGAIHLAHNYLPTDGPPAGSAGPPAGAAPAGGGSDLMSLVGPYLTEVFILNFVAFVGLAVVFGVFARARPTLRVLLDGLLVLLSAATLYAWNAFGRANPSGTGTLALVVELALIGVAVVDALVVLRRPA
jgi:hypothetical protein